jgi:predicted glycosyltransferase
MMTYSHDGYGLGHLRRNRNIAAQFVQDIPGSTVLMLIGCPSPSVLPLPAGIDYIKIPSVIKVATEAWHMRSLRVDQKKGKALRASIIQKSADVLDPQILLVDHIPGGVWGELLPTLRMLKGRGTTMVLGLRDILDSPEVTRAAWREKDFYQVTATYYDHVFIYGCRDVFDTASQYGLDGQVAEEKISYCGYVCSNEPHVGGEELRRDLHSGKEPLVLITAGGGYDAYPLMQACLDAFQFLSKPLPFGALFITGPLMAREQRDSLRMRAAGLDIPVLTSVENSLAYMNAADLVVTMAGYNSLCEVLHLKKKALVVPRAGPSAEHAMRARLFAGRGLIDVLDPRDVSPKSLAQRIIKDLERSDFPLANATIDTSGANNVACRLSALARQRGALRPMMELSRTKAVVALGSNPAARPGIAIRSYRTSPGK